MDSRIDKLRSLPMEVLMENLFPHIRGTDLYSLSKTNLWWNYKVRLYLTDFALHSISVSDASVHVEWGKLKQFLNRDVTIIDLFPLMKLVHLKILQQTSVFWNRSVKGFIDSLSRNGDLQNVPEYWKEKTEDLKTLSYLNAKHDERLRLQLKLKRNLQGGDETAVKQRCNLWNVNVSGGKIVIKKSSRRGEGIVDIDDTEVLNY